MNLDDILLKREEVVINRSCYNKNDINLTIPIHPEIINDGVGITNRNFCKKALERALKPYFDDLKKYIDDLSKEGNKEAIFLRPTYLIGEPKVIDRGDSWKIHPPGLAASAEGNIIHTLKIDKGKVTPNKMSTLISSNNVKFPKRKFMEYRVDSNLHNLKGYIGINGYAFTSHSISTMPQALMLRAWAVEYLNMYLNQLKI